MDIAQPLVVAPVDLGVYSLARHLGEMVIEMELGFKGRLDEHLLALAGDLLLDAEPVLGCRLVVDTPRPRWERVSRADRRGLTFTHEPEEYEGIRCTGLDATANVQLALCLWRCQDSDRLLLKMTHEAGDGVGLQLLAARLSSIYSELCADSAYRPRPNLEARRDLRQILSHVPRLAYPRIIWDFVRFLAPRWFPRSTHELPLPRESAGTWVPVIQRVPPTHLSFLSTYGKARGATLNDVFLAGAYRALASHGGWDGTSGLRISITVDLRRWCLSREDARSICNLSSFEYPFLVRNLGRDFEETLANVTALTRRRKKNYPGLALALISHFLMKRSSYEGLLGESLPERPRRRARAGRPLTLSNEGALDKARLRFGTQTPVSAHILPPFLALPGVHICLSGYDGALTLAAVTPQNGHAVVESFLNALVEELPIGKARNPQQEDPLTVSVRPGADDAARTTNATSNSAA